MKEVFFYGLFMDEKLLREKGIDPKKPRKALIMDYELRIGERATLIPSAGETSYGILMRVSEGDLEKLYSESSVSDYVAEKVKVVIEENESIEASCYNLPKHLVSGENKQYAYTLLDLVKSLGFPKSYVDRLAEISKGN